MVHNQDQIIAGCKKSDPTFQKLLYDNYKSILFGICRRYLPRIEDAEDVLVESFIKIFSKLDEFKNEGSFEGWMKKITVNEALMFLRRNKRIFLALEGNELEVSEEPHYEDEFDEDSILELFDKLPDGYRAVLNLYAVEGYKHKEIAEMLGISINTSKSQLILARKKMQEIIRKNLGVNNSNKQ